MISRYATLCTARRSFAARFPRQITLVYRLSHCQSIGISSPSSPTKVATRVDVVLLVHYFCRLIIAKSATYQLPTKGTTACCSHPQCDQGHIGGVSSKLSSP